MDQRGRVEEELLSDEDEENFQAAIQTPTGSQGRVIRQSADFRSNHTFPPFSRLPDDNSIHEGFYTSQDEFHYFPRRHWCFFGEVVSVQFFARLRIVVRDKSGTMVPIAFYDDGRGTEFLGKVRPGFTVAILYAIQHGFLDLTTGIRLEDCSSIEVNFLLCSSSIESCSQLLLSTRSSRYLSPSYFN